MKCILCGKPTTGSVGATGTKWSCICQTCKDTEDKALRNIGPECWEVDALPPNVLSKLIRDELKQVVDMKMMKAIIAREEEDKTALKEAVQELER